MKKTILTSIFLSVLLTLTTVVVLAGSAIELVSVVNDSGGVRFTFRVNGNFSKSDLKGNGHISGGNGFTLNCKVDDDPTLVICHAPKKTGGQSVSVTFGGATFWTDVPEQRIVSDSDQPSSGEVTCQLIARIIYDSQGNVIGVQYVWICSGPV